MVKTSGTFESKACGNAFVTCREDPVLFDGTLASNLRFVNLSLSNRGSGKSFRVLGFRILLRVSPKGSIKR